MDNEINSPEDFDNAISHATEVRDKRLQDDEEYALAKYYHKHTLITAMSVGILNSYAFYHSYQVPVNFEVVMNEAAKKLLDYFKNESEVFKVSLLKLKKVYRDVFMSIPQYVEWNNINNPEGGHHFTSSYDNTPNFPSFIDLEWPVTNAICYLRGYKRISEAFDKEFEESWAADPNNPINMGRKAFLEGKTEADNPFLGCPTTGVPTTKNPNGQDMSAEWLMGFREEKKSKPKKFVFIKTSLQNAFDDNNRKISIEKTAYYNKRCQWFSVYILPGMVEDFIFDEHEGMPTHMEGQFVEFSEDMIFHHKQKGKWK